MILFVNMLQNKRFFAFFRLRIFLPHLRVVMRKMLFSQAIRTIFTSSASKKVIQPSEAIRVESTTKQMVLEQFQCQK